jgi:uncharacterized protein
MNRAFQRLFCWLMERKRAVARSIFFLLRAAIYGVTIIPLEHSLEVMLPSGSDTQDSIRFLQEIDFSAKVVLSFSVEEEVFQRGEANRALTEPSDWMAAVDAVFASMDSPLILKVVSRFDNQSLIGDIGFFIERVPELLNEQALAELEATLTPAGIRQQLQKKYVQLLKPEGSFMSGLIRRDPLDLQQHVLEDIKALSASFGYRVKLADGHLVSEDGRHKLVMVETSIPFTDAAGSRELVSLLESTISQLPDGIRADMVCGHLHTLSNERVVKRDIALTVSIAAVSFLLLFLLFFKDWRANLIFFLPLAALLLAVNFAAVLLGTISQMMLGFGSVIAGVAVDYGIHVYIAVRRGKEVRESVAAVAKPVLLGALTTAGVFVAFLFSSIPGYRQLATFALLSVILSVLGALLILPLFLVARGNEARREPVGTFSRKGSRMILFLFAGWLLIAIPVVMRVQFDSNVACLDGTEQPILDAEGRFQQIWGSGETGQAIAAVSGATLEQALEESERLYQAAEGLPLTTLNSVWKPASVRKENVARWQAFWSESRLGEVRRHFVEQGQAFGFAEDAFEPFFASIGTAEFSGAAPENNQIFQQLSQRFVQVGSNRVNQLSYFPDESHLVEKMMALKEQVPSLMLISREALTTSLARDYTAEFSRISVIALVVVLGISLLLLRNLKMTLVVLMPALAGVVGVMLLVTLVGARLNVMNLISGIIVIGLCIDYGIFYVHSHINGLQLGTRTAISLSAGTTLIGVGALLFARHPALFSVGLTLMGGISAGYLTSMFVVPALCNLMLKEVTHEG